MAKINPLKYSLGLIWSNSDVSKEIAPYVKSLSYSDTLEKKKTSRDQINISLNNKNSIFLNQWMPKMGDSLRPQIKFIQENKSNLWAFGEYAIDSLRFRFSPDEVIVGALAQDLKDDKLNSVKSRSWSDIYLKDLLEEIAIESNLKFVFYGSDLLLKRVEQQMQSTNDFLSFLAKNHNISIQIKNKTLVKGIPKLDELFISLKSRDIILRADFPTTARNVYTSVIVQYYDEAKKENIIYQAGNLQALEGQILRLYDIPVSNISDAKYYANSHLGNANGEQEANAQMTLINTPLACGQVINLLDAGKLPKKWQIQSQSTSFSSKGWQSNLQLQRIS